MSTFLFSIKSIAPIFSLIIFGIILRRINVIDENFISKSTKLIFNFAMPVMIFQQMLSIEAIPTALFTAVIIFVVATMMVIIISWLLTLKIETPVRSSIAQGAYRSNLVIIGLAVIQNVMSETAVGYAIVLIAIIMPLYNLLAIIILGYRSSRGGLKVIITVARRFILNPLIWGILIGLVFGLGKISVPEVLRSSLSYFSQITLPLALIGIGGSLRIKSLIYGRLYWSFSSILKLIILPSIIYVLCLLFKIDPVIQGVLVISASCPTAVVSFVMADGFGADSRLAGEIISVSTVASIVTISIWISILM